MRIGFQMEHLDPTRGGAETYVCMLVRQLVAEHHEVHVFTERYGNQPAGAIMHIVEPYGPDAVSAAAASQNLDVVVGSGKCLGMNIFQPHDGTFLGSRRQNLALSRSRVVCGIKAFLNGSLPKRRAAARLERIQFTQSSPRTRYIALSKMVYRDMRNYYGVPEDRLHLVYNGVDVNRFSPERLISLRDDARREWGIPTDEVCFLIVAQNYRRKGLRELVEAAACLRTSHSNFRILVVGKGNSWRYRTLAARLGCRDKICFAGAMRDVERAYSAADAFVLPTWYDPCSLVLLEAWACGLPVITTRHNGAGELMTPGREGFVINEPNDTEALSKAMAELMDTDRRLRMGRRGRVLAEQHTLQHNYREMLAVFEMAANERRRVAA